VKLTTSDFKTVFLSIIKTIATGGYFVYDIFNIPPVINMADTGKQSATLIRLFAECLLLNDFKMTPE
jgi:hypothetical protein